MSQTKRKRARAIIFKDNKIVAMYRERKGIIYYTFPGGGIEGDESEEDTVVRELFEEFGITVKPIKKVYIYENEISLEHFFICDWLSGEIGNGHGEEFVENNPEGIYINIMIEIAKIPTLPLMPPEIAKQFVLDYSKNGENLTDKVVYVEGKLKA